MDGDQTDNSASSAGAAYVFTRSGTAWTQSAYVKASNAEARDNFGQAVALSSDGNTLLVGAPNEASNAIGINGDQTDNSLPDKGAAYLFTRSAGTWVQKAYLKPMSGGDVGLGLSVALSGDGKTVAAGSYVESGRGIGINGDKTQDTSKTSSGGLYLY
ncbi:MAG: hypothetical protein EOO32_07105 [Comamonadaceae bacterium]|nr:MAG: hypothetical protein EOO32_07105 [Comamonadaceae bacterium]